MTHHKTQLSIIMLCLCLLVISGCDMFPLQSGSDQSNTVTLTPAPTDTPADVTATPACYFNWAYPAFPDEQLEPFHNALTDAGYTGYELSASSYGEDYVCTVDNEVVSVTFHLMDITPKILLTVDSLSDKATLSAHVRQIVTTLEAEEPNVQKIGRIEITFTDGTESLIWSAVAYEYTPALDEGITDEALFALGTQ